MEQQTSDINIQPENQKIDETSLTKDLELEDDDDFNMPEDEMKNIINYINKLDYDKYAKDMEIREALQLIKNKMEKESQEKQLNQQPNPSNENINNASQQPPEEKNQNNKIQNKNPEQHNNIKETPKQTIKPKPIIDENKIKKEQEKQKYKVFERLAKNEKFKAIHSTQSVKQLLQSQGLDNSDLNIQPLQITIIKEKVVKEQHQMENKLPFLHSLPLV